MSDHLLPHDAALERLRLLHPNKIDLSLDRTLRLLGALGDPHLRLPPTVHVAGTNGKGSTVAFLRAMAEAQGLRVHVFTSPHLVHFRERIRLAGSLITEEALAPIAERVETANAGQPITFFEIITVIGLLAFCETPADLCLIEVGLGGRFDSTNVIPTPAMAVVAPVDLDHREFLGDSLEGIAREKAGIFKPDGSGVVGRQQESALEMIEAEAARVGASLAVMGRDFDAWREGEAMVYSDETRLLHLPLPGLAGDHQIDNAGLAIAALLRLKAPVISAEAIEKGLSTVVWPARMQRLTKGPLADLATARGSDLWLDGGHNPHAAQALARHFGRTGGGAQRPLVLIMGLLANKDARGVLAPLKALNPRLIFTGFSADAAARPEDLQAVAREIGMEAEVCGDVERALRTALSCEGPAPRVLICGSLYLAGEVLNLSPDTWPV